MRYASRQTDRHMGMLIVIIRISTRERARCNATEASRPKSGIKTGYPYVPAACAKFVNTVNAKTILFVPLVRGLTTAERGLQK